MIILETVTENRRFIVTEEIKIIGFYKQFRWNKNKPWLTYDAFTLSKEDFKKLKEVLKSG